MPTACLLAFLSALLLSFLLASFFSFLRIPVKISCRTIFRNHYYEGYTHRHRQTHRHDTYTRNLGLLLMSIFLLISTFSRVIGWDIEGKRIIMLSLASCSGIVWVGKRLLYKTRFEIGVRISRVLTLCILYSSEQTGVDQA